jgi:hypothetical protein
VINIQRLKYLKDERTNAIVSFVADFVMQKTQRDSAEFYRYEDQHDWEELDQYFAKAKGTFTVNEIEDARKLITEIIDSPSKKVSSSFSHSLKRHWNNAYNLELE